MEVKIIGKMDHTIDHTFESANRVYDKNGIAPTINTCGGGGLQPKIIDEVKSIGNLSETKTQIRTVYDSDGISPTLCSGMDHGNTMPHIVDANAIRMVRTEEGKRLRKDYESGNITHGFNEHREMEVRKDGVCNTLSTVQKDNYICEQKIVAMRGRNPDNPSDRTVGAPTEQRLEPNSQGICNTLTSVQKDNMVLEKQICAVDEQNMNLRHETFGTLMADGSSPKHNSRVMEMVRIIDDTQGFEDEPRIYDDVAPTLRSQRSGLKTIESQYRIRKLTPKECWRLMSFTDEDFHKAEAVNSNTQLYKQAGNSIVVNVLEAILGQMIPGKEDVYKMR